MSKESCPRKRRPFVHNVDLGLTATILASEGKPVDVEIIDEATPPFTRRRKVRPSPTETSVTSNSGKRSRRSKIEVE